MPIYDFKCQDCGKISELLLKNTSERVYICPECGSQNMKRLLSSSYLIKNNATSPGSTCCGRAERCQEPPCSTGDKCRRD